MCKAAASGKERILWNSCEWSLHVQGSDIIECLEGTHYVEVCQRSLLVQSSNIPECLEGTHFVDVCQRSLHVQGSGIVWKT